MAREPDRNERENPSAANRYAAAVLRDLDDRIDRLENAVSSEGTPNILRSSTEPVAVGDDVAVSTSVVLVPLQFDDQDTPPTTWDDTDSGATWA